MHEQEHWSNEAANHLSPISAAFWTIWIVSLKECSSLTQNLMQICCSNLLSHFECDGLTVHMLTQQHLPPPLTSTVKSPLFTQVHSSPLSLADGLQWCCTNHCRYINNCWAFSRQIRVCVYITHIHTHIHTHIVSYSCTVIFHVFHYKCANYESIKLKQIPCNLYINKCHLISIIYFKVMTIQMATGKACKKEILRKWSVRIRYKRYHKYRSYYTSSIYDYYSDLNLKLHRIVPEIMWLWMWVL